MGSSAAVVVATIWVLLGAVPLATAAKPRHPSVPKSELSHPCSRAWSRTVRQRFQSHVARQLKSSQRSNTLRIWPDACPFSPLVDFFGWHEKNKSRSKNGGVREWLCNYTGKTFKNEHYMDLHLERNFPGGIPDNGTCLADYCEVFGFCKVVEPAFFDSLSAEPPPCDPIAIKAQQRTCMSVINLCTFPDDPDTPNLNSDLNRTLCEPLTCEFRAEKHHSNRKLCLVGGASMLIFVLIAIILYCACVPSQESWEKDRDRDQMLRKANKRLPKAGGREQKPPRAPPTDSAEISDVIPTRYIKQE